VVDCPIRMLRRLSCSSSSYRARTASSCSCSTPQQQNTCQATPIALQSWTHGQECITLSLFCPLSELQAAYGTFLKTKKRKEKKRKPSATHGCFLSTACSKVNRKCLVTRVSLRKTSNIFPQKTIIVHKLHPADLSCSRIISCF
jgi:hypothetical protein